MGNISFEKTTNRQNYTMPIPHSHRYYELYVLAQGERTFYVENQQFNMSPNSLLLVPRGILHYTTGSAFVRYLINFTEEDLTESQKATVELLQQQQVILSDKEMALVGGVLDMACDVFADQTKSHQEDKDANLLACFNYFFLTLSRLNGLPSKKYTPPSKGFDYRTKAVIEYLQEHYAENITLDMLCKNLYISKHALCHLFKKDTDMTIIDFLINIRLKQACNYLRHSDLKISKIAELCGFSSQNYFYLIFTKHMKISPSQYRKIRQEHFNNLSNTDTTIKTKSRKNKQF